MIYADNLERLHGREGLNRRVVKVAGHDRYVDFTLDDEGELNQLEESLRIYLGRSGGWFTGGAVTVNAGRRVVKAEELARLRRVFEDEFGLKVTRFWCDAEALENALSGEVGVPVALEPQRRVSAPGSGGPSEPDQPLFVKGTCRSGTSINHAGDIIILGDVNPGAEVKATGDIVVLGTLRGIGHAGNNGADPPNAIILALALRPIQLRIGDLVSIPPRDKRKRAASSYPEIAYVSGSNIVVAPFTGRFQNSEKRNGTWKEKETALLQHMETGHRIVGKPSLSLLAREV